MFGEVASATPAPRAYPKSNIPFGGDATDAPKSLTNGNGNAATNGNGIMNGNGYDSAKGHNGDLNGHTNGTTNGSKHGKKCVILNYFFLANFIGLNSISDQIHSHRLYHLQK